MLSSTNVPKCYVKLKGATVGVVLPHELATTNQSLTYSFVDYLDQKLANYSPCSKSVCLPVSVNKVLLEYIHLYIEIYSFISYSFVYCL